MKNKEIIKENQMLNKNTVPAYLNFLWPKFTSIDPPCDLSPTQGYKMPFKS